MLKELRVTIEKQRGPGAASPLRHARTRLRQATVWRTKISEKAKGKLKEAAGAITGAEANKAEGRIHPSAWKESSPKLVGQKTYGVLATFAATVVGGGKASSSLREREERR